ncbi:MAG: hypothetical protein WCC39_02315 [Telluria sp.]
MATILAHAVMMLAWQATRLAPRPNDVDPPSIQWIRLPARVHGKSADDKPRIPAADGTGARARMPVHPVPRAAHSDEPGAARLPPLTADSPDATPPGDAPTATSHPILDQARRAVGAIDRALRKENNAYIVAPLDSPQIRMRRKMEEAAALAPRRFWEAPKIEEVVNDSGDGTRRTRVTSGGRTYCITERSFATSIDMVEKHGKQMITDCSPDNEKPVGATQAWRTARD